MQEKRLTPKELAAELRRHVRYIYGMRVCGFCMPGGTATLAAAVEWLEQHPGFRQASAYPEKRRNRKKRKRMLKTVKTA